MKTKLIHSHRQPGAVGNLAPRPAAPTRGFSLVELLVVAAIAVVLMAIALPRMATSLTVTKWRGEMSDLSGVFQSCRSQAIKNNQTEQLNFTTSNGQAVAYLVDLDKVGTNGTLQYGQDATSMMADQTQVWMFSQFSKVAAPTGTNPPPLTKGAMWGGTDTTLPDTIDKLCFNSRGIPCNCPGSTLNPTPPPAYCTAITNGYAYYFQQDSNWAAVGVSPAGRIQTYFWTGNAWSN
jgi:prepilin-type N-terminal cleavage/methylation domain-containing protein